MKKEKKSYIITLSNKGNLFDKVVSILDQARSNAIKSINNNMVIAYWLIGKILVEELQGGDKRAEYGKKLIEELSKNLNKRYTKGFSATNLWYFRQFYNVYSHRKPKILHKLCGESQIDEKSYKPFGVLEIMNRSIEKSDIIDGFSATLSWSHYRSLSKVENKNERLFYEIEAEKEAWSVPVLDRQIHTCLFARLLKSKNKEEVLKLAMEGQIIEKPTDTIKNPYILDFLGLPNSQAFHESELEKAIINNLQAFLLELGKGFAFVGRQKRLQYEDEFFYIDLVFYNCILKCYMLIDLKIGKLTHQDVGQMDSYVRMFDEKYIVEGDNPTIGLILCSEKNAAIARYSVLKESKQLFASKYKLYLPTEEELKREIEAERASIDLQLSLRINTENKKLS